MSFSALERSVGLAEVQAALALLYTSATLRRRFYDDPDTVGAELGLARDEVASIRAMRRDRIESFAATLVSKRFNEVTRLLPRTVSAMGDASMRRLFDTFAPTFAPAGESKHVADAMAFASWLAARSLNEQKDDARVPSTAVRAGRFDRAVLGLFHRAIGNTAAPRRGPRFALLRNEGGSLVLLARARDAGTYRGFSL